MFGLRLEALPLRRRFLVVPALGLLLIAALTLAFVLESRRHNALLEQISTREVAELNRLTRLYNQLSAEHMRIFDLLTAAGDDLDEEALYVQSRHHLDAIRSAAGNLEQALGERRASAAVADPHAELTEAASLYRRSASTAIELATVDLRVAERQLGEANARFVAVNELFTRLLETEREAMRTRLDASVRRSRLTGIAFGVAGIGLAAALVAVSLALSRLLVGSLERQLRALTELGRDAGAHGIGDGEVAGGDEISAIGGAIDAFRGSLLELRRRELELSDLNRALTEARDRLELRVEERTRELSEANAGLSAEVELRRAAEERLRIYAEVIHATGEAVVITEPDGEILEVNPAYERVTGYRRREVIGKPLQHRAMGVVPDEQIKEIQRTIATRGAWSGEISTRRKNGEVFPAWATINAVRDEDGEVRRLITVSRDISELKESEAQLHKLAFYDTLTGLPNRALFADRLTMSLAAARRAKTGFAVLYLDLDRFKYVNDTLGHPAGDKLLIEISERLSAQVRAADTIARLGGDEFTLLLNGLHSEDEATPVAERLIGAVSQPVDLGASTVFVGASIGISFFPRDAEDADTLRKYADLALYEAKQAGRGQYRVFDPQMIGRARHRLTLSVRLDAALDNAEFILLYQPIVRAGDGAASGLEALIRWRQPDGTVLLPGEFLPHAEEAGLIKRIDLWVLERACTDAAAWRRELGRGLRVCVNLSAASLQQPALPGQLAALLERTGLPPELLNIEVSETAVVVEPLVVGTVLRQIAELGVDVSMDDFGTVYSTLTQLLAQFPIHHIKLGRSFVERIGKDEASERLIHALLELTRRLHIDVVAIGVEGDDQQSFLHGAGCQLLQGYHFGPPLPGDTVLDWVSAGAPAAAGPAKD